MTRTLCRVSKSTFSLMTIQLQEQKEAFKLRLGQFRLVKVIKETFLSLERLRQSLLRGISMEATSMSQTRILVPMLSLDLQMTVTLVNFFQFLSLIENNQKLMPHICAALIAISICMVITILKMHKYFNSTLKNAMADQIARMKQK